VKNNPHTPQPAEFKKNLPMNEFREPAYNRLHVHLQPGIVRAGAAKAQQHAPNLTHA